MAKYVIGIDVGTTGSKAMVVDLEGNIYGGDYKDYPLISKHPEWQETKASELKEAVLQVAKNAVANSGVDPTDIAALSFSTQRGTVGLVDENLEMIEDTFITWMDTRAEEIMDELSKRCDLEILAERTGLLPGPLGSGTSIFWLYRKRPDMMQKAKYIATPDAYIMHVFGSDEFVSDISCTQFLGVIETDASEISQDLCDIWGFEKSKFPKLVKPGDIVGRVSQKIADEIGVTTDTLIVCGIGDQQAGALGSGLTKDGDITLTVGTGGFVIVGNANPDFRALAGLQNVRTVNLNVFQSEGIQFSGANCYRWAKETLYDLEASLAAEAGKDPYDEMTKMEEDQSVPGSNGVIFNAALYGGYYPGNYYEASGSFIGIKGTTTKADILRSVMEGISLGTRYLLEGIRRTGIQGMSDTITVTGGATKSPLWRQIMADVLGYKIRTLKVSEAGIIGAAGIAALGAGLLHSPEEIIQRMVHYNDIIEPIQKNKEIYDKEYAIYQKIFNLFHDEGIYEQLNAIYD